MKIFFSLITLALLLISKLTFAQDSTLQVTSEKPVPAPSYKLAMGFQLTGIGFSFANPKAFTVKYFTTEKTALEYIITPGGKNILGTSLLLQRHFPIQDSPHLKWYVGAGTNLDIYRYQPITTGPEPAKTRVTTTTTLIGTLGAEYSIPKAPFTISGDIKSGIFGYSGFGPANRYNKVYGLRPSISFRYVFNS